MDISARPQGIRMAFDLMEVPSIRALQIAESESRNSFRVEIAPWIRYSARSELCPAHKNTRRLEVVQKAYFEL